MAECDTEKNRMKEEQILTEHGFQTAERFQYADQIYSTVYRKDNVCVILDYDLCRLDGDTCFDYSKYCELQNKWMAASDKLFRFYISDSEADCNEITDWLDGKPENMELNDTGGSFDKAHIDNTPLEKSFEDLFTEAYGKASL